MCKAGFADDDYPMSVFPSIIGTPRMPGIRVGTEQKEFYIGYEAQAKQHCLKLKYPIEHGMISNWDDMEKLWHHTFYNELKTNPDEHPVLLTDVLLNCKPNREKMIEIMFDEFKVPAFFVINSAYLALYSSGKTTGVVVDSGGGVTQVAPVYEGYPLYQKERIDLGGRDITNRLVRLLLDERGHSFYDSPEREIVTDMKEKLCYVAWDYNEEMSRSRSSSDFEKEFELPDCSKITLGKERFMAPEALFQPNLIGLNFDGVGETTYKSIIGSCLYMRRELFGNIVLSGGTTMLPGFRERLSRELINKVSPNMRVNIGAPYDRKYSVWEGGRTLSSLSSFQQKFVTRQEYEEEGPRIVHRTC